ncbi:MAG: DUF2789 family protein [Pseudomonadota bacterium]
MEANPAPSLNLLFAQLGLPDDDDSINRFVASNAPLAGDVILCEAPFWTGPQAAFLRGEFLRDAEWAPVVDTLDAMLRKAPEPAA